MQTQTERLHNLEYCGKLRVEHLGEHLGDIVSNRSLNL